MSEEIENKEISISEKMGIIWKDKLSAAEWLDKQPELIRSQYEAWIELMPQCMNQGRLSDKKIRMLPVNEFLSLVNDFLNKFGLASKHSFFKR